MQESYERVRKCAKVKGRVELKIDQTQSKRPLVTIFETEPVFELNLALSEERPTYECRSDSGIFVIELLC